ncbi:decarboxylase [Xaviernesmea oryzae]|uniref:Decarboxylase n=1 Tax=Xaviernesmea oryzae TaxID=464029 RepID=A0A1Q9B1U0_9HYPH|nr:tautomerase family protein [Xaviernesmea oryzae]OLP61973.1 decarboxylase [Xaviernesmea oryzae]SEK98850.1 Tautomerase enzyme [Xaviernesmea oryzae]
MPFTRISLHAGKPPAYLAAIADSLDRALVDCFEVPENDRFVAFDLRQPGELIFDRHYRGGPRSDDYVLFQIMTGRARASETKARFFRRLADNLAQAPGLRREDVMVIIVNSQFEDWSFASGEQASTAPREARS